MKIVFFGSDDFAQTHLDALVDSPYEVVACVTQPDRPRNRGMKMVVSPIKECAQKQDIPVLQPENIKDAGLIEALKNFEADLFVVISYGRILPADILNIPKLYAINVHGSFLPKYRGAAPINWVIINGEIETGLSIIKMNTAMDAGDILAQKTTVIFPEDTSITLRARMMQEGARFLLETMENIATITPLKQDEKQVTIAPKLIKELGHIDWNKSAVEIHNLARGLLPWPGAYTFYEGKPLKILDTEVLKQHNQNFLQPGKVIEINKQGLIIATGNLKQTPGVCLVKEVQLAGSKRMDAASFVRGHHMQVGFQFDSNFNSKK